jgi:hypothetical protein
MPGIHPDIAENIYQKEFFIFINVFYPPGEPILPHQLRCGPFTVYRYSFMGHFLAAAVTLARE